MLSPVRLSSVCLSVCLSSVTFVRPTQAVQIVRNISKALGTKAIHWHSQKFYGDRPTGTPSPGELNTRGVAKCSDFGPIDGYISETVQDIAFDRSKIAILGYPSCLTPPAEGFPWDDLRQIFCECQRTAKVPNGVEKNFNRLSRPTAHGCYRQTTDRRTDGRATAYGIQELIRRWDSERELFFTTSHM